MYYLHKKAEMEDIAHFLPQKAASRKLFSSVFIILSLFALGFLSGCATLTTGTSQSITVSTVPPGALCTLKRKGKMLGVVNPTPGTINIKKGMHAISIICRKKDYLSTAAVIKPHLRAMTFGNILFGGIIGVAVDAGTGAMDQYPSMMTVILPPSKFASTRQRDTYYNKLKADYLAKIAKQTKDISENCGNDKDTCQYQISKIKKREKADLTILEHKRLASVIIHK